MPDAIALIMQEARATHRIDMASGVDVRRHEDFGLSAFDRCCLQALERAEAAAESDVCIIVEVWSGNVSTTCSCQAASGLANASAAKDLASVWATTAPRVARVGWMSMSVSYCWLFAKK